MRIWIAAAAGSMMALGVFAPASAQDRAVRAAHDAITRGDMADAERVLTAEQRIFPDNPEVLINLAAVYAKTGRATDATTLYRRVMARDDVLLDLSAERTASSHALAQTGLQRVAALQTASR